MHTRRWLLAACLLVLLAQSVLLAVLAVRDAWEPHRVPVIVSAPAVVAHDLAAEADAMPGEPFAARWTADEAKARAAVRDGDVVAAVLVDLRETRDVVLLNPRNDPGLNDAVTDRIAAIEQARDRTIEVEEVRRTGADGSDRVRAALLLCGLLGFGYAVVVSLLRGPVAATAGLGVARFAGLVAVSAGGATLLQVLPATRLPGDDLTLIGLAAGYAVTLGALTMAVEALAGLAGLAAVAAAYSLLAAPLITGTSHYLLPLPWPVLSPWTPTGAAQEALAAVAYFDPDRALRPALVVGAALLVAVVGLLLARAVHGEPTPGASASMSRRHWRLWVVATVVPLGLVLALSIAWLPTGVVPAQGLPSIASQTRCLDDVGRPRTVGQLNRRITQLQGSPAFLGADVGADVRLADGRFLLVFGDTLRAASFDGPRFARNSMMLWGRDCVSVVLPPDNGALIPDRGDGVGYWPMSTAVAHRPGYDLVLVSTQRVRATGGGSFDFANLGPALAVFVVPEGGTPQLVATEDLGPDDDDPARPEWGAALAVADGWLYAYGTARPDDDSFGFSLQVARVRPDDVLDARAWRYWDGTTWQRDPSAAAELVPADGGVSQTLSVFRRGERWYVLSKRDGDLGDELVFWSGPAPTGPFEASAPVASLPWDPGTGAVTYMPLAHPQVFPEAGTVVASYSRNNVDFAQIEADPTRYRPRFLRVPLPE